MDIRNLIISAIAAATALIAALLLSAEYPGITFLALLFSLVFLVSYLLIHIVIIRKQKSMQRALSEQISEVLSPQEKFIHDTLHSIEKHLSLLIAERKKEIEHLKKLETYRKEYIGNVSHELKTPVFNIQGYISTLLDGGLEDPNVNRKFLERAEKSVERMITIIEDLQTITQFETGQLVLEIENFDIVALSKDVCDVMEMRANTRNIKLSARENEKPIIVSGDRFRIRQVITNLIVNSIKYGKDNGETRIKIRETDHHVMVEVTDNGIGIDKKHLPRLFERFYRVDKSRSRDAGGSGLGLSIVKHIVEAHGQTISVMSTEGVGSVFSFTLSKAKNNT
ncbi:MAG: sensor histidine kinase [Bacteroidota bacterium]